jgi:hypothetical protein
MECFLGHSLRNGEEVHHKAVQWHRLPHRVGKWLVGDKVLAVGVKGVASSIEALARAVVQTGNGRDDPRWAVFTPRLACVLSRAASSLPYSHVVWTPDALAEALPMLRGISYFSEGASIPYLSYCMRKRWGHPSAPLLLSAPTARTRHVMCVARHDFVVN